MATVTIDAEPTQGGAQPRDVRGRSRRRRRAVVGLLILAAAALGAVPAWRAAQLQWYRARARRALGQADAEGAIAALESAQRVRSNSAEIEYLLGAAHRRAGHLDRASEHLAAAAKLHWSRKQLRRQLLMLSFQAGQIEQSQREIDELLAAAHSDAEAEEIYECLVKSYLTEYRLDQAKTCLDHWIAWQPRNLRPRLWRADLFSLIDKQQQLNEYQDLLQIAPDHSEARLGRAQLFLDAGRVKEAAADYQWSLERSPDNQVAILGLAACQRRLGDLSQARQMLTRLVSRDMSNDERSFLLTELGRLDLAKSDYAAAAAQLSDAVELDSWNATAHYSLGIALGHLGRKQDAQRHLARWKEIDDLRSRLTELERRIIVEPRSSEIRNQIGEVLMQLGQKKEAASWYLSALRCDAEDNAAHRALAAYYTEIGRADLAQQHRGALDAASTN